jgi:hypothetical protein
VSPYGPDPKRYVEAIGKFVDAGFERIALRAWSEEILPALAG